jgi:hypothetical protein
MRRSQDPTRPREREPITETHPPTSEIVYVPVPPSRPRQASPLPVRPTRRPRPFIASPKEHVPERTRAPEEPGTNIVIGHPTPVGLPEMPKPKRIESPKYSGPKPTIRSIRPPNNSINSDKNSDNSVVPRDSEPKTELNKPNETVPLEPFERIGRVGRQRKYEERKNGINSVRDVVLYRHVKGKHYPGLSSDMRRWYEFFYFRPPMKGEKPFNANTSYEQHVEANERGQDWIRRYESHGTTRSLGHSGSLDLQARRAAH